MAVQVVQAQKAQADTIALDFRRIYEDEVAFVWTRLRRLGVPERDLEDKVHDVFLVAYRRLASYDPARPIRPWLAGISVRVALDHGRLAYQRREIGHDLVDAVDGRRTPDSELERREARDVVLAALGELPADQRAVLVLREIEGFSMPEIAEMLAAPLNTLYSRLRLAREKFFSVVQRLCPPEGEP
jgi:RNA polymerase sigma-70 factor, ECF subfamily